MKSHVTLIGINFYPEDTAIGLYSTQMCQYLIDKGYHVNVITGFPYYPQWKIREDYLPKSNFYKEKIGGIHVFRYKQYVPKSPNFKNRILHILDFTVGSLINCNKIKKSDLVISIVPFTSSIFLGWVIKKRTKAKLWVHIQDFEFDAAFQTGLAKEGGIKSKMFNMLFKFERWMLSKADIASSISYTMLEKLKSKTGPTTEIEYLPNWIEIKKESLLKGENHSYLNSNKFKILYSGNIGDKQDWGLFLKFIQLLDENIYDIIVVGNGSKKSWLEKVTSSFNHIHHYEPVPYAELSVLLKSADLHILFQKNTVKDTVMPSKLLGMMASGVPSLVTGNKESEVRKIIEESSGGYYVANPTIEELNGLMKRIRVNKADCLAMGLNAKKYVLNNFSKEKVLGNAFERLNEL